MGAMRARDPILLFRAALKIPKASEALNPLQTSLRLPLSFFRFSRVITRMTMSEKLNKQSVEGWLEKRPGWSVKKDALMKEFHFKSFRDTIVFVNRIASLADETGNRPDIVIRGETVRLTITTPDAGGITQEDLDLAQRIDFATSAR
jgi:4a-hydroxytetrahydrobiopterin dehydratase